MPLDTSIPLQVRNPRFMTPAEGISLKDMVTQQKLRQAELDYLPQQQKMEREQFDLDRRVKLSQLGADNQKWLTGFKDKTNARAANQYAISKRRGMADPLAERAMQNAIVEEIDAAWRNGSLAQYGVTEEQYQQMRLQAGQMTYDQIARTQEEVPDFTGMLPTEGGNVPLSGIPGVVQSPESAVPNPNPDFAGRGYGPAPHLTGEDPNQLRQYIAETTPTPEGATPRERALVENYEAGPGVAPLGQGVPLSQVSQGQWDDDLTSGFANRVAKYWEGIPGMGDKAKYWREEANRRRDDERAAKQKYTQASGVPGVTFNAEDGKFYKDGKEISASDVQAEGIRQKKAGATNVNVGMTAGDAGKAEMLIQGINDIADFRALLIDDEGNINTSLIYGMALPGGGFGDSRLAYSLFENAINGKLRAETGATATAEEMESMKRRFMPSPLDNDKTVRSKLRRLDAFLRGSYERIKGAGKVPGLSEAERQRLDELRRKRDAAE